MSSNVTKTSHAPTLIWSCGAMGISSFILITFLLVASLVAGLLTIFFSLFATNYPKDGGNSSSSDLAGYAALFSGGAAATGDVVKLFIKWYSEPEAHY